MSDNDHCVSMPVNFRDWICGTGEWSEDALRKSRKEWADSMAKKVCDRIEAAFWSAFSDLDAEPAAIAEPSDWGTRREGQGTGNTQEPVAWAVFVDPLEPTLCGNEAFAKALSSHYACESVPLYERPQPILAQEERSALQAVVSGSDVLKWQEIEAVVRGLLERTK